ncbi:MAG TPA: LAGLIDADG family homing endonuclease, partial [Planococcus sp. (in: firmicutes)]|nr:LAGLIDADG family homing endonuclease [Planococcus sp. (in: firmicutes)]
MIELPKNKGKSLLSEHEVIRLYLEGYSTTEIGNLSNVSSRYIRLILNKNNVEMRPVGSWKRKFEVNENFFKIWSNNMAYILGFFMADGCIVNDQQTISFAQKEKYILEQIKEKLNSDHPIIQNPNTGVYVLNIHSKIMKSDLRSIYGITSKKSKELKFPNVPEEFISHFIRGYFDGDGYVNYKSFFVSIVGGSLKFMEELQKVIEYHGFETNFTSHTNHYRVYVSGRKTIK